MSDLGALAERVIAQAKPGEEIEAYVARGHDLEVRVYDGEVESLSSATTGGIGVRVLSANGSDGARLGFAWAGSLGTTSSRRPRRRLGTTPRFATPDPDVALASPDGVEAAELDLWDPSLAEVPTDDKVALALELERRVRAGDPRIRQVALGGLRRRACRGRAGLDARDRAFADQPDGRYLSASPSPARATTATPASATAWPGRSRGLDARPGGGDDAVERSTRMLGAKKAPRTA